jgi:hypothetical protein
MSNPHTPLPWHVSRGTLGRPAVSGADYEVAAMSSCGIPPNSVIMADKFAEVEANAALIVRAVNSHAVLVEALREIAEIGIHEIHDFEAVAARMQSAALAALAQLDKP